MYDSFKIADDEIVKHRTKSNWNIISQQGNSCVRKYELDKFRYDLISSPARKIRSQAFLMYHNGKPAYVLQIWPVYRALKYGSKLIMLRREKMGFKPAKII